MSLWRGYWDNVDTTLIPPGTQYGATVGELQQRKPLRYEGCAKLRNPVQQLNYHS